VAKIKPNVSADKEVTYNRYACLVHPEAVRKHCPICGQIYCRECDPDHIAGCRESNNVGN